MKKVWLALTIVLALVVMVSCSQEAEESLTEATKWVLYSATPISATSNNFGTDVGVSIAIYKDSKLVSKDDVDKAAQLKSESVSATPVYCGGINEAAQAADIKKISHVDTKTYYSELGQYKKVETLVYGN